VDEYDELGGLDAVGRPQPAKKRETGKGFGSMRDEAERGEMTLWDLAAHQEIDRRLAGSYLLAPRRPRPGAPVQAGSCGSALCAHNGAAALECGRRDVWRVWMAAACALRAIEPASCVGSAAGYPLTSRVLGALLQERLARRDVQTVAALSCVALSAGASARRGAARAGKISLPPALGGACKRCRDAYARVLARWSLLL